MTNYNGVTGVTVLVLKANSTEWHQVKEGWLKLFDPENKTDIQ